MGMSPAELRDKLARTKNVEKRLMLQTTLGNTLRHQDVDEAEREMALMLEEYSALGFDKGIAQAQNQLGHIYCMRGALHDAIDKFILAKEHALRASDEVIKSGALLGLGIAYRELGKFSEALSATLEALTIQDRLDLHLWKVASLQCITSCYEQLSDFKSAIRYGQEGLDCARKAKSKEAEAAMTMALGLTYEAIGDFKEAVRMQENSLAIHQDLQFLPGIASNLGNLGTLYLKHRQWEKALACIWEALQIQVRIGDKGSEILSYQNLSKIYLELGQDDRSEQYAQLSMTMAKEQDRRHLQSFALICLADVRSKYHNRNEAKSFYLQALNKLGDYEIIATQVYILESLVKLFEVDGDSLMALEYQRKLMNARTFELKEQNHRDITMMQIRLEVAQMEHERELYKQRAEQAVTLIEKRTQELSELSSQLSQRRDFLQSLRDELSEIERSDTPNTKARMVRKRIDSEMNADRHMERVDTILADIQPEFVTHLSTTHPSLSKAEIKICLFLKLDLRTLDIANLLFTSERTVEHHRSHIRKKMKLSPKQSLQEYLKGIDVHALASAGNKR